jgi:hypothetical protein
MARTLTRSSRSTRHGEAVSERSARRLAAEGAARSGRRRREARRRCVRSS